MAHECPDCGQVCYCGNDIDDMLLNDSDAEERCTHYLTCEGDDEDDELGNYWELERE